MVALKAIIKSVKNINAAKVTAMKA